MRLANIIPVAALFLAATGCNTNESVANFAKCADQLSDLLPRVAAVPYNACIDQNLSQQIDNATSLPDRAAAEAGCKPQEQVRDRVSKQYGVLTLYLEVLGKLASGKASGSAKSIGANSAKLQGFTTPNQDAVSGLADIIASAYLHGRTSRALREAIEAADPHVQALCKAFASEIAPAMSVGLQAQEQQLKTLYDDNKSSGPVHVLLLRQFDTDEVRIAQSRDLVKRYSSSLENLAAAHAKLYRNRNRLNDRDTLNDLLASSDAIAANLKAAGK